MVHVVMLGQLSYVQALQVHLPALLMVLGLLGVGGPVVTLDLLSDGEAVAVLFPPPVLLLLSVPCVCSFNLAIVDFGITSAGLAVPQSTHLGQELQLR